MDEAEGGVRALLGAKIGRSGPIRFDHFIELALYDPDFGYYARGVPGPGSDYETSPSLTPLFGVMMARQLKKFWQAQGEPAEFTVIEAGAGGAYLAAAAISGASASFRAVLTWCFIERFPQIARRQEQQMAGLGAKCRWAKSLDEVDAVAGAVLANEVLDNFPVRLFEIRQGKALEIFVGLEQSSLCEVLIEPLDDPFAQAAESGPLEHLEDYDRFEFCPGLSSWAANASKVIPHGHLMILDYGDEEPWIWTERPAGTLVTYRSGQLGFDPLAEPGACDVTTHVNFTHLKRASIAAGFTPDLLLTQRQWLKNMGITEIAGDLRSAQRAAESQGDHSGALSLAAERSRVSALAAEGGLGDLKVFIAEKGLPLPG